jgi:hypothetical protein
MGLVVTGLSQTGDVSALKAALHEGGYSLDPLQIIAPDDSTEPIARGLIGSELIVSEGGTGVPGLNNAHRGSSFFRNETLSDRLGDLEIPDSETDNYVEALERAGPGGIGGLRRPDVNGWSAGSGPQRSQDVASSARRAPQGQTHARRRAGEPTTSA